MWHFEITPIFDNKDLPPARPKDTILDNHTKRFTKKMGYSLSL